MLFVCFVLFFVVCFSSTLSPRPDRSVRSGNNLMRLVIILQHAIMAYHVQIAHKLHVISRLDSCCVRKSCYCLILRLRHLSLIVHSRSKLVHVYSLLYDDITACEYGELSLVPGRSLLLRCPREGRVQDWPSWERLGTRLWRTGFRRVWYKKQITREQSTGAHRQYNTAGSRLGTC